MTNLGGGDIKWRVGATSGRRGLKNFPFQNGSRVTLPAGIIGLALIFSKCWDKCARKKAKKWRFGDFEVPPDWKEGVKSKNCYNRSIPCVELPPCTNFQRKIWQNVLGCTLGFFLYHYKQRKCQNFFISKKMLSSASKLIRWKIFRNSNSPLSKT